MTEIEVTRTFANFEDYWDTQAMPFSPSGKTIAKLTGAQRAKLRDLMRETLPADSLDNLSRTLVDGNVSPTTRDGLQAYAAAHPGDRAGLLFMVLATPEFQLN